MARKKVPKKRTKTAIAARKYERKLKQRARAGEPKARDILQRREQYRHEYQERRKRRQEEESARARCPSDDPDQVDVEDSQQNRATPTADSAIGGSETGEAGASANVKEEQGEQEEQRSNPLFVTPAPEIRRESFQSQARDFPETESDRQGAFGGSRMLQRWGYGGEELAGRNISPMISGSRVKGVPMSRTLRGGLAQYVGARRPSRHSDDQEDIERLRAQRQELRQRRETLLRQEIDIEIKLHQQEERSRARRHG